MKWTLLYAAVGLVVAVIFRLTGNQDYRMSLRGYLGAVLVWPAIIVAWVWDGLGKIEL